MLADNFGGESTRLDNPEECLNIDLNNSLCRFRFRPAERKKPFSPIEDAIIGEELGDNNNWISAMEDDGVPPAPQNFDKTRLPTIASYRSEKEGFFNALYLYHQASLHDGSGLTGRAEEAHRECGHITRQRGPFAKREE